MSKAVIEALEALAVMPDGSLYQTFNNACAAEVQKRVLSAEEIARHDEHIAIQKQEDEDAINSRVGRLYKVAIQYLGADDVEDNVRAILDESANPYEAARVAMVVMQRINSNFGIASAKGMVDRLLNIVSNLD